MKKIISIILVFIVLTGCGNSKVKDNDKSAQTAKTYAVSSYITKQMEEKVGDSRMMGDTEGLSLGEWAEKADSIVLATVVSIDEAKTVLPSGLQDELGFTLGRILVQKTYKGENNDGKLLKYLKAGGIITMEQMNLASDPEAVEKREYLREQNGGQDPKDVYVNTTLDVDIMLEEGKTYFLLLHYVPTEERYEVFGFNTGIREAEIPRVKNAQVEKYTNKDIKLKNNDTQEFEDIDTILSQIE